MRRATIGEVVAVDRRDDDVGELHLRRRLREAERLERIRRTVGLARVHVAVPACARAGVAEDLERRRPAPPALADVRAACLLADRDEATLAHEALDLEVAASSRSARAPSSTRAGAAVGLREGTVSIATSLETWFPRLRSSKTEHGLDLAGEGGSSSTRATCAGSRASSGATRCSTARRAFEQIGVQHRDPPSRRAELHVPRRGGQEDFLVLSGECLLVVEGEERLLKAWDFVHVRRGRSTSSSAPATARVSSSGSARAEGPRRALCRERDGAQARRGGRGGDHGSERRVRAIRRRRADPVSRGVPPG